MDCSWNPFLQLFFVMFSLLNTVNAKLLEASAGHSIRLAVLRFWVVTQWRVQRESYFFQTRHGEMVSAESLLGLGHGSWGRTWHHVCFQINSGTCPVFSSAFGHTSFLPFPHTWHFDDLSFHLWLLVPDHLHLCSFHGSPVTLHCSLYSVLLHWPVRVSWGVHISLNSPWTPVTQFQLNFTRAGHNQPSPQQKVFGREMSWRPCLRTMWSTPSLCPLSGEVSPILWSSEAAHCCQAATSSVCPQLPCF